MVRRGLESIDHTHLARSDRCLHLSVELLLRERSQLFDFRAPFFTAICFEVWSNVSGPCSTTIKMYKALPLLLYLVKGRGELSPSLFWVKGRAPPD